MTPCGRFWATYALALLFALAATTAHAACERDDLIGKPFRGAGEQTLIVSLPDGSSSVSTGTLTCSLKFRRRGPHAELAPASWCRLDEEYIDDTGEPRQDRYTSTAAVGILRLANARECRYRSSDVLAFLMDPGIGWIYMTIRHAYLAQDGKTLVMSGAWGVHPERSEQLGPVRWMGVR